MPITDIDEFFKFYDDMSDEDFNAALDESKPDDKNSFNFTPVINIVDSIFIELAFLVLKSHKQIFSPVQIRSIYDIVKFDSPIYDTLLFWKEYRDWEKHYEKECEIQHLPQETEYFEIIYKTVQVDVNPF